MPKQLLKIENFEGGLNDVDDPRDLLINEFSSLKNCIVSKGRIVMAGGPTNIGSTDYPAAAGIIQGYGLFAFSTDRVPDAATVTETDVLVLWDDDSSERHFFWITDAASQTWAQITASTDLALWATSSRKPCFFYLDGALRISDGASAPEPTIWWGFCKNNFFDGDGSFVAPNDWFSYIHDIKAPVAGNIFGGEERLIGGASGSTARTIYESELASGVNIWIRNAEDQLTGFTAQDDGLALVSPVLGSWSYSTSGNRQIGNGGDWNISEVEGNDAYYDDVFLKNTFEIDDEQYWEPMWTGNVSEATTIFNFHTDQLTDVTFTPTDSMYIKFHISTFQMDGFNTHVTFGTGGNQWTVDYASGLNDGYWKVRLFPAGGNVKDDDGELDTGDGNLSYLEWKVPSPVIAMTENEVTVIEFPYTEATAGGAFVYGADMTIDIFELQIKIHTEYNPAGDQTPDVGPLSFATPKIGESGLIFNDPVNSGPREWGSTYVYDGKQESAIRKFAKKINLVDKKIAVGLTILQYNKVGLDSWDDEATPSASADTNHRITGTNIYFYDKTGTPYRVAECDFRRGVKASTSTEFPDSDPWTNSSGEVRHTNSNVIFFSQLPRFGTYQSYNGFSADEQGGDWVGFNSFKASFGNAAVSGRKLIVGPVYIDTDDGKGTVWHNDMAIAAKPSKYDQFPNKTGLIEVIKDDGDKIIALSVYADRLLQFKKKRMYLINISSNTEYLEDVFEGKGVEHPAAVFETDFGITWANNDGCYLYDGEKVFNLIEKKISDSTWSGHFDADTLVGYHANSRKIIVTGGGSTNRDAYIYDLNLKSWSFHNNVFSAYNMTNFVRNSDGDLLWGYQVADGLYKWSETAVTNAAVEIITRDIDFESPGQRKNIYKIYVTHKGDASNIQTYYAANGVTAYTYVGSSLPASSPTTAWVTTAITLSATNVYSLKLKFASTGTTPANFEINDISVVFRVKHII